MKRVELRAKVRWHPPSKDGVEKHQDMEIPILWSPVVSDILHEVKCSVYEKLVIDESELLKQVRDEMEVFIDALFIKDIEVKTAC